LPGRYRRLPSTAGDIRRDLDDCPEFKEERARERGQPMPPHPNS
jgi:hypothetical protein